MTILLVGNQKGGVGKSTIACNIAAALANESKDVLLIDADRQSTSSLWVAERRLSHSDLPKVHSVQKYDEIDEAITDLITRYQHIIIDAAGRDSLELRSAMLVCNVLLMPFRTSHPDLAVLPNMNSLVRTSKRLNPDMKAFAFINSAPTNSGGRDDTLAKKAIMEYPDITLLETTVHDRRVFRDVMADGLGVTETSDKSESSVSGRSELVRLIAEVM